MYLGAGQTAPTVVNIYQGVESPAWPLTYRTGRVIPTVTTERVYTVDEAAQYLRISKPTLYRLMRSGEISYRNIGKRRKLTQSDIDRFLSESRVGPEENPPHRLMTGTSTPLLNAVPAQRPTGGIKS